MAIDFPSSPTSGQVYTYGSRTWTWTGVAWQATTTTTGPAGAQGIQGPSGASSVTADIQVLDNQANYFDDRETVFAPTYNGDPVTVTNPLTLDIFVNGVKQKVSLSTVCWDSPVVLEPATIRVNDDGNIFFASPVASGSTFEGRIIVGATTTTMNTNYPFAPMDILMGAF
jgi:hypothetical protein